jgi:hypothetical protein
VARPDDGLYVINAPSPAPNEALQIYEQVLDFWTRYQKTEDGYNKLQEVLDILHQRANYELSSYHVFFSHALGLPEDMDRDIERRKLYKLSFRLIYRPAVSVS